MWSHGICSLLKCALQAGSLRQTEGIDYGFAIRHARRTVGLNSVKSHRSSALCTLLIESDPGFIKSSSLPDSAYAAANSKALELTGLKTITFSLTSAPAAGLLLASVRSLYRMFTTSTANK